MRPYIDSHDLAPAADGAGGDPAKLRERALEQGYLYISGLIPPDELKRVRAAIAGVLAKHGWLRPGTDPLDALTDHAPVIEGRDEFWPVFEDVQSLEVFHSLAHHPRILGVFRALFGEQPLPHARNIFRAIFPNAVAHSTPAHQDYVHIQGTTDSWTCWMPLGDAPAELGGGLPIAAGSHKRGLYPVRRSTGAGNVGIPEDKLVDEWHQGTMKAGDALIFHSHTVHKGLPNTTPDRMRLSVDFRYQPVSHPVTRESMAPHFGRRPWEEYYKGWGEGSAKVRNYWNGLDLKLVDFDPAVYKYEDAEPAAAVVGKM